MKHLPAYLLLLCSLTFAACSSKPKAIGEVFGVPVYGTMYDLMEELQYNGSSKPVDYLDVRIDRGYIWVMADDGSQQLILLDLDEETHRITGYEVTDHLTLENE